MNTIAITPKSEDKYVVKVFNWPEVKLSEMTGYKIYTLVFNRSQIVIAMARPLLFKPQMKSKARSPDVKSSAMPYSSMVEFKSRDHWFKIIMLMLSIVVHVRFKIEFESFKYQNSKKFVSF